VRFVTFDYAGSERAGVLLDDTRVLDLSSLVDEYGNELPDNMIDLIDAWPDVAPLVRRIVGQAVASTVWADATRPLSEVKLRAPIRRTKKNVFCVGRNYADHVAEGDRAQGKSASQQDVPQFFTKAPTCISDPDSDIPSHVGITRQLDYEVELAVVIGRRALDVPRERAFEHVFGYTILNDITARDMQRRHGQWFKGKSLDGSCPIGPWIVDAATLDPVKGLHISLSVNGETRQSSYTNRMIWGIAEIIEYLSAGMTLEPGDIIATGTPSGVGYAMAPPRFLKADDVLVAEISGIGRLVNRIADFGASAQIQRI
jgi:2-keto-4-pentenoate hydratase/2-oxohepta-3-ene-1,7-dioic acid hydratase in catechol pathway